MQPPEGPGGAVPNDFMIAGQCWPRLATSHQRARGQDSARRLGHPAISACSPRANRGREGAGRAPLSPRNLSRRIPRPRECAGLPPIRFHDLPTLTRRSWRRPVWTPASWVRPRSASPSRATCTRARRTNARTGSNRRPAGMRRSRPIGTPAVPTGQRLTEKSPAGLAGIQVLLVGVAGIEPATR